MEPLPVTSIGKYRIDGRLGAGAMGILYRAFDPHIERRVALKTIRRELFDTFERAGLMARFRNEAQAAGRLAHPNIVGVYDYGETDGTAYIAMELVEGRGLSGLLEAGRPLDLPAALGCFEQLLDALGFAHEHGVVHRDIKPANLLLTAQGQLKVTDFGIAHIESSTMTVVGSVVGTPSYMSPEQFAGDPVDGRSDLFSAAVVLYQMLTGQRPFVGASQAAVMQQVLRDTPRAPSACNPALPAALDDVLLRALSKDRAARFQSPAALRQALFRAVHGTGTNHQDDDDRTVLIAGSPEAFESCHAPEPAVLPSASLPGKSTPLAAWSAAALAEVEARLAAQVGPVARLLVARCAARTADLPALVALLVPHIPSDKGRRQFTEAFAEGAQTPVKHATSADVSRFGQPLTAEQVQTAALNLAAYLGPIAHIVAKREAPRAAGLRALHDRLADAIPNEHDRARFRRDVGLQ
jgi:serine/threonine-protein kinase